MRIEPLGDIELIYRDSSYGQKLLLVRPFGGEEGSGYGEGEGTIKGDRIKGTLRWVNHSSHRGDGSVSPHFHGAIRTDDGANLMFTLQGKTVWVRGMGKQLLSAVFETEDSRYRWLNDSFCVVEGAVDSPGLRIRAHIYACVNEMV